MTARLALAGRDKERAREGLNTGMQRLILLRHGEAARPDNDLGDFERALTARGREDAHAIGGWLAGRGESIDLALVSPALRARQTWDEVAQRFPSVRAEHPTSFYAADPGDMLETAQASGAQAVLIVAHNPGLQTLAVQLAAASGGALRPRLGRGFSPAAVAVFARDESGSLAAEAFQSPADLAQMRTA